MLENAINIANDRITQTRCAETGKSAVTAFTVMWRRMFRTQPMDSRQPQIRHNWLSSAAQMVGLMKKYLATTRSSLANSLRNRTSRCCRAPIFRAMLPGRTRAAGAFASPS